MQVLCVHKYSISGVVLDSAILISSSYFSATSTMIYGQYLTQGFPEPQLDLKYPGILLFMLETFGNFYHHQVLASLRTNDDKEYKIPKGGLFDLVICPRYLFEVLGFIGIFFISQTLFLLLHFRHYCLLDWKELRYYEMVPFQVRRFSQGCEGSYSFCILNVNFLFFIIKEMIHILFTLNQL